MLLYAFKGGRDTVDSARMNSIFAANDLKLVFEGSKWLEGTGNGTRELNLSTNTFGINTSSSGTYPVCRMEFQAVRYGEGADLAVEVWDSQGTVVFTVTLPAKLFTYPASTVSVPLSGVGDGGRVVFKQAGDAANHVRLIAADTTYESNTYLLQGSSWVQTYQLKYTMYVAMGNDYLTHTVLDNTAFTWLKYDADGNLTEVCRWMLNVDGEVAVYDRIQVSYVDGVPVEWKVVP
ncbi:hypothetical protein Desku_1102 [Desulfofundulus kuznetsovii DSM 6115]|uniref:Uncharacterized protein n=1 Tax=Desulfofundulus kuznetsovii (strain DSM 6115 / VKM B-1805 / 17) TaxID=760568 RepID=A0AAU8PG14_DESK7|nr:hypothetical protein Desku_1102 [Desulfofundulus kuznetsovii DSM 6115]